MTMALELCRNLPHLAPYALIKFGQTRVQLNVAADNTCGEPCKGAEHGLSMVVRDLRYMDEAHSNPYDIGRAAPAPIGRAALLHVLQNVYDPIDKPCESAV